MLQVGISLFLLQREPWSAVLRHQGLLPEHFGTRKAHGDSHIHHITLSGTVLLPGVKFPTRRLANRLQRGTPSAQWILLHSQPSPNPQAELPEVLDRSVAWILCSPQPRWGPCISPV